MYWKEVIEKERKRKKIRLQKCKAGWREDGRKGKTRKDMVSGIASPPRASWEVMWTRRQKRTSRDTIPCERNHKGLVLRLQWSQGGEWNHSASGEADKHSGPLNVVGNPSGPSANFHLSSGLQEERSKVSSHFKTSPGVSRESCYKHVNKIWFLIYFQHVLRLDYPKSLLI